MTKKDLIQIQHEVIQVTSSKESSKERLLFQKAMTKNQKLKSDLEFISNLEKECEQRIQEAVEEPERELEQALLHELIQLDALYENPAFKLNKKRQQKLSEIIQDKGYRLLKDFDNEEAQTILDKYDEALDEEEEYLFQELSKQLLGDLFQVDLEEEDFVKGEPDYERIANKVKDQQAQQEEKVHEEKRQHTWNHKKTKQEALQEKRKRDEENLLNKDIQSLFKELAKQLHPDTELDERLKLEKQELMKQLVNARDEHDIFELLKLRFLVLAKDDNLNLFDHAAMKRLTKLIQQKNNELERDIFFIRYHSHAFRYLNVYVVMQEKKMRTAIQHKLILMQCVLHDQIKEVKSTDWSTMTKKDLQAFVDQYSFEEDDDEVLWY